jgi:hypothetical protein
MQDRFGRKEKAKVRKAAEEIPAQKGAARRQILAW